MIRDNHQGTKIFASREDCTTNATPEEVGTTDQEGNFDVTLSVEYHCLQAVHAGYLSEKQNLRNSDELSTSATTNELGTITLLSGDVTGDGQIDIFDMAKMAGHYGESDQILDLNISMAMVR